MKTFAACAVAVISLALLLSAEDARTEPVKRTATTSVKMMNVTNQEVGEATLTQTPQGVLIHLRLANMKPGAHAFHIHEAGKCEPPFESAGAHFNPAGKKHGVKNPNGRHAGDLPNLHVPDTGALTVEVLASNVNLRRGKKGLLDADGAALVIHEKADDYQSDPAGEAGGRIVCGAISAASLDAAPSSASAAPETQKSSVESSPSVSMGTSTSE